MTKDVQQQVDKVVRWAQTSEFHTAYLMDFRSIVKSGQRRKLDLIDTLLPRSRMQLDWRRLRQLVKIGVNAEILLPGPHEANFARVIATLQAVAQLFKCALCTSQILRGDQQIQINLVPLANAVKAIRNQAESLNAAVLNLRAVQSSNRFLEIFQHAVHPPLVISKPRSQRGSHRGWHSRSRPQRFKPRREGQRQPAAVEPPQIPHPLRFLGIEKLQSICAKKSH